MLHPSQLLTPFRALLALGSLATIAWSMHAGLALDDTALAVFGTTCGAGVLFCLAVLGIIVQRSRAAGWRYTTPGALLGASLWFLLVPLTFGLLGTAAWGAAIAAAGPPRGSPDWIGRAVWGALACVGGLMAGWRWVTRLGYAEAWRAARHGAPPPDTRAGA